MKCPYCGDENTGVVDSRGADNGHSIRRRRVCEGCKKRFTTYEKIETIPLSIIKKDNNREEYRREKIEMGVVRACYKRPVSAEAIQKLIDSVETEIYEDGGKEISSRKVGELVMNKLKLLDSVAYVRFASVYREFKDAESFVSELKRLLEKEA